MAKYRHRIFEMYDFRDEAIVALTPKSEKPAAPDAKLETWPLKHISVTRWGSVTLVQFQQPRSFPEETVSDLRDDLAEIAQKLTKNTKVLLDFTGVTTFCQSAIDALVVFHKKLRNKGSRIALCCLDPEAREYFFAGRPSSASSTSSEEPDELQP